MPRLVVLAVLTATLLLAGGRIASPRASSAVEPPPTPIAPRVVGGSPIAEGEYPWLAALLSPRFGGTGQFCGGALVAPQWVLTAAHCVKDPDLAAAEIQVALGRTDLTRLDAGEQIGVEQIVLFPTYDLASFEDGDAALLRLSRPSRFAPIVVATQADAARFAPDTPARVLGWGVLRFGQATRPPQARQADLPIVGNETCNLVYNGTITERMVCAGPPQGGRDSCQGDSGGPLVVRDAAGGWLHVGIVSFGEGCGVPNFPGVYARSAAFSDWIAANINGGPYLDVTLGAPEVASPAQQFSQVFVVGNGGTTQQTNLVITGTVPSGASYLSSSDGGVVSGTLVTWEFPDLFPGEVAQVSLVLSATQTVRSGDYGVRADGGLVRTGARARTTLVDTPRLVLRASGPETGSVGSVLNYRITASNVGLGSGAVAENVVVSATLPGGVSFVSGGEFANGVVSWTIPRIRAGAQARREVVVRVERQGAFFLSRCNALAANNISATCSKPATTEVNGFNRLPVIIRQVPIPTARPYPAPQTQEPRTAAAAATLNADAAPFETRIPTTTPTNKQLP